MSNDQGVVRCTAREEAGPRDWSALTGQQQKALVKMNDLIDHLARVGQECHVDGREYEARYNHVILLDGPRGSGKTSALISGLRAYDRIMRREPIESKREHADSGSIPFRSETEYLVIPLPILDLHPLNEDYDLIVAIAARFEMLSRLLSPEQSSVRHLPRVEDAWARLVEAIAMSGAGSRARLAAVGPDEVAIELRGARPDLAREFRGLVTALSKDLKERTGHLGRGQKPLFLLPIDDADLVPHRTEELVQVLRSFYDHRVVFVLTGDSHLFVRALRASILEQLWGRLTTLPTEASQLAAVGPADYAAQLARELYDRVIPRGHRCRVVVPRSRYPFLVPSGADKSQLSTLWRELLDLRVMRSFVDEPGEQDPWPTLGALVRTHGSREFGASRSARPQTTPEAGQADGTIPRTAAAVDGLPDDERWRVPQAIPARLRTALDLGLELKRLVAKNDTEAPLPVAATYEVLHMLWDIAVDGCGISHEHEARVRRCVQLLKNPSRLQVDGRGLHVRCSVRTLGTIAGPAAHISLYAPVDYDVYLEDPDAPDYRVAANRTSAVDYGSRARSDRSEPLSPAIAHTLALIVDATRYDRKSVDIEPLPVPAPLSVYFVGSHMSLAGRDEILEWPFPNWAYLEIDRFSAAWQQLVEEQASQLQMADNLLWAYISLTIRIFENPWSDTHVVEVAATLLPGDADEPSRAHRLPVRTAIEAAFSLKQSLASTDVPRSLSILRWLQRLGALVSPLFGLSTQLRGDLEAALRDGHGPEGMEIARAEAVAHLASAIREDGPVVELARWRAPIDQAFGTRTAPDAPNLSWEPLLKVLIKPQLSRFRSATPAHLLGYLSRLPQRARQLEAVNLPELSQVELSDDPIASVDQLVDQLVGPAYAVQGAVLVAQAPSEGRPAAVEVHVSREDGGAFSSSANLLTLLAWDVKCDLGNVEPRFGTRDFPGLTLGIWHWPCPAYPAAFDLERFANWWNALVVPEEDATSEQMLFRSDFGWVAPEPRAAGFVDDWARAYVRVWDLVTERDPDPKHRSFEEALERLFKQRVKEAKYESANSARWRAFKQFRNEATILAASEMRLGEELAAEILEVALEHQDPTAIRGTRRSVLSRQAKAAGTKVPRLGKNTFSVMTLKK